MGVHSFPIAEAQGDEMTEVRRDMWSWAEPVIADRAAECYDQSLSNRLASNIMAKKHCRLWQAVIYDQHDAVPQLREDLRRMGDKFGLDGKLQHRVNTILFDELFDIVLSRYRTSRRATKAFSLVLLSATSCLNTGRAAA